jgi:hypothetical protein
MPELVQLGKDLGERGLVIVGINFDKTLDKTKEAIEQHGQTWPQVYASAAAKGDEHLWRDCAGIEALPRFLVVDRTGVLRVDAPPQRLAGLVRPLLDEAPGGR